MTCPVIHLKNIFYLWILSRVNNVALSIHDTVHRNTGKIIWVNELECGGE